MFCKCNVAFLFNAFCVWAYKLGKTYIRNIKSRGNIKE